MTGSPDNSHDGHVARQFGPQAAAYVQSAVHAAGADLDRLETIAQALQPRHALDLGSGGGHVAYRIAGHAGAVTACDLSAEMLAAVAQVAAGRGDRQRGYPAGPGRAAPLPRCRVRFRRLPVFRASLARI